MLGNILCIVEHPKYNNFLIFLIPFFLFDKWAHLMFSFYYSNQIPIFLSTGLIFLKSSFEHLCRYFNQTCIALYIIIQIDYIHTLCILDSEVSPFFCWKLTLHNKQQMWWALGLQSSPHGSFYTWCFPWDFHLPLPVVCHQYSHTANSSHNQSCCATVVHAPRSRAQPICSSLARCKYNKLLGETTSLVAHTALISWLTTWPLLPF
jgi:hypothetical protein